MFAGAGAASKHYGSEALAYVQVERSFLIKSHTLPPPPPTSSLPLLPHPPPSPRLLRLILRSGQQFL